MSEYIVDGAEPNNTVLHTRSRNGYELEKWLAVREEIVRCRDCVHMLSIDLSDYYGNPEPNLEVCKRVRGVHLDAKPDGFCAWGERKEGE